MYQPIRSGRIRCSGSWHLTAPRAILRQHQILDCQEYMEIQDGVIQSAKGKLHMRDAWTFVNNVLESRQAPFPLSELSP